jgi:hypothetical protein
MSRLASEAAPLDSRAELRAVGFDHAIPESWYAAAGQNTGFGFILSTDSQPQAEARTGSPADPARPVNSPTNEVRPAFRDASGLTDAALDQILGDDLDQLSTSAKPTSHFGETSGLGAGSQSAAAGQNGAGGGGSGISLNLGQAAGGPISSVPDNQNGGLMGGGGVASMAGAGGSAASTPNLITNGHFTPGVGGPHGTITPYTSGPAWPSYTPPASGGSGGGPPLDTVNSGSGGSNGGSSGGINNSNNGTSGGGSSGGMPSGGGPSGGMQSGGGPSGGGQSGGGTSGGCSCGCSGGGNSGGGSGSMTTTITNSASIGDFMIENAPGVEDHSLSTPSVYSPAGVRYFDGQINITSTDLGTGGFGNFWNQTRSWSNGTPPTSNNGTNWIDMDRPYLLDPNGDQSEIIVVSSATDARFFNLNNGSYSDNFYLQDQLTHNSSTGEFVFTDTIGDTIHFFDFSGQNSNQWGQFKSCTDPMGNTISVTSWTSSGTVAEMQRYDPSSGVTQSYVYTYLASPDPNAGQISNITLRQKVGNGAWTVVRQVAYDYYDGTSNKPYGNLGDLRSATTLDANKNVIDTTYYRYYTSADAGNIGYVHGLKYVFSPQSCARLAADISNPMMTTDAQVAPYADAYYQYSPTTQQVTEAVIQGSGCSVCTGGQGTFTYSYATSVFQPGYNTWAKKTVETLPDGSTNTVYANFAGETMLDAFQSGGQPWINYYQYDSAGRLILQANPSAVIGYLDGYPDLVDNLGGNIYSYVPDGNYSIGASESPIP